MKCFRFEDNKIMPGFKVTDEIMLDKALEPAAGLLERASLKFLAPPELATPENQQAINNYDESVMLALYPCFITEKDTDAKDVFILQYPRGSHRLGGIPNTVVVFLETPGHSYCLFQNGAMIFNVQEKAAAVYLDGEFRTLPECEAEHLQENLAREYRVATGQTKITMIGVPGKKVKKHPRKIKTAKNAFAIEVIEQSGVQQSVSMPPPDWRWLYACKLYKNPRQGDLYKDFALFKLARYLELQDAVGDNIFKTGRGPLNAAVNIWREDTCYACARHVIEACVLAGASAFDMTEYMGNCITPGVIFYYKKIFFELPGAFNEFWLEQHIFGPAQKLAADEFLSGYMWKKVAIDCGIDVLLNGFLNGRTDDKLLDQLILYAIREMKRNVILLSLNPAEKNKFTITAKYLSSLLSQKNVNTPEQDKEITELVNLLSVTAQRYVNVINPNSQVLNGSERYDNIPRFTDEDIKKHID